MEPKRQKLEENSLVSFKVGNQVFSIGLAKLAAHPDTMLGRLCTSNFDTAGKNADGQYIINHQVQPELFEGILDYYRTGYITFPDGCTVEDLIKACDYFLIELNPDTVELNGILLEYFTNKNVVDKTEEIIKRCRDMFIKGMAAGKFVTSIWPGVESFHFFDTTFHSMIQDDLSYAIVESVFLKKKFAVSRIYAVPDPDKRKFRGVSYADFKICKDPNKMYGLKISWLSERRHSSHFSFKPV